MDKCDVLIVGGGPAGSSCAWKLRSQGMDVVVMDKAEFPRDKVCAGWITPAVAETLQLDLADYAQRQVLQPITGFRTGIIGGNEEVLTRYGTTVSYGIRRREFDHYLLARTGASLQLGQPLKSLERQEDRWIANGTVQAKVVIGAGGHFCPVARLQNAGLGGDEVVVAAKEVEFELSAAQAWQCTIEPETPELFFCQDLKGYGWCFRKGRHLNIGLGREDNQHLPEHLKAFCDFLQQLGKIPSSLPERFHGHAYLLYRHGARNLISDGLMLIGDAAGLAYPQSGEGIRPAVESGLMAADTILAAKGDFRRERLDPYRGLLAARFGNGSASSTSVLPETLRTFLAGKLLTNRWFTRHVVLDRWFLHNHQAAHSAA
jgi:geranylgeranyl reductase family protein